MSNEEIKAKIIYSKTCQSRYIAHLDTIDVISKALRRLQLPYAVTQGCHVRPKLTFGPPLPLGHASFCEFFIVSLVEPVSAENLQAGLNRELPQGMKVLEVIVPFVDTRKGNGGEKLQYRLGFSCRLTAEKAVNFLCDPEVSFVVDRKGKNKSYRLGDAVRQAKIVATADSCIVEAEFIQGLADVPSVSKIVTALAEYLGNDRESFNLIERVALSELTQTGDSAN